MNRQPDYFNYLNRINKKYLGQIEKDYGLSCSAQGGELWGNIKSISLTFFCFQKKTIEEARALEVHCVERFCKMINSHEKIRPYLEEFPFSSERIIIMISFYQKDFKNFPPEESISSVNNAKGKIIYRMSFNDKRPDQTVLEETYSEAYEKVKDFR